MGAALNIACNADSASVDELQRDDVIEMFDIISQSLLPHELRVEALNSLFDPRIRSKLPLYERCGLFQCLKKVMVDEFKNLKNGNNGEIFKI